MIYTQQTMLHTTLYIPSYKPPIQKVMDVVAVPSIGKTQLSTIEEGYSCEGILLLGNQLLTTLLVETKLTYITSLSEQSLHALYFSNYKSLLTNLPLELSDIPVHTLIEHKNMVQWAKTLSIHHHLIDATTLHLSLLLELNVHFITKEV